ncbi:MAG: protease modulator HflC [Rickettsiales bacterium]
MQNNKIYINIILSIIAFLTLLDSIFVLEQRKYGVIFQFGEAIRTISEPGLHIKIPFVNDVIFFEKRLSNIDSVSKELTTKDGKRIIVDAFSKFKIKDPVLFYKKMNNKSNGERLLESAMRQVIGTIELVDLFSLKRPQIMMQIKDLMNHDAENFGINIVDVRIVHSDFPEQNSKSIYKRMETERVKESMQIRAEGSKLATEIRSKTDKEILILLSESYKRAEEIKAEGDKESIKLYSEIYSKDYEFFKLYRTLESYRKIQNSKIVVSPKSEFLEYLHLHSR